MCSTILSIWLCQERKSISQSFIFPLKDFELNRLWIRYVNQKDWKPRKYSVLCELHFEENYIIQGGKSNLKWWMNPIPTFQGAAKNAINTTNQ